MIEQLIAALLANLEAARAAGNAASIRFSRATQFPLDTAERKAEFEAARAEFMAAMRAIDAADPFNPANR